MNAGLCDWESKIATRQSIACEDSDETSSVRQQQRPQFQRRPQHQHQKSRKGRPNQ
jgi:hypothetical protein